MLGFVDEVWRSCPAQLDMHTWWGADAALHLIEKTLAKDDPDLKALADHEVL
jgi:hypothetical protein